MMKITSAAMSAPMKYLQLLDEHLAPYLLCFSLGGVCSLPEPGAEFEVDRN
jgi:hypothetical protein